MLKLTALNEIIIQQKGSEEKLFSKKNEERAVVMKYNRALLFLSEGSEEEALLLFEDVLESPLLKNYNSIKILENHRNSVATLKYSCLKNIACINTSHQRLEKAIENYSDATVVDTSDFTTWYKLGVLALNLSRLELSALSFKIGLKRTKSSWQCMDYLISILYSIPDYISCLQYIRDAVRNDPWYIKGWILKKEILRQLPTLKKLCHLKYHESAKYKSENLVAEEAVLSEIKSFVCNWKRVAYNNIIFRILKITNLELVLNAYSWLELGKKLINLYNFLKNSDNSFLSGIKIILMIEKEPQVDLSKEVDNRSLVEINDCTKVNDTTELISNGTIQKEGSVEVINKACDKIDFLDNLSTDTTDKVKKKRRNSLNFLTQWAWSTDNTKRISRARQSGRRLNEKDDISLEEAIESLFPSTMLDIKYEREHSFAERKIKSYFEELNPEEKFKEKIISSINNFSRPNHEEYFQSKLEVADVKEFIIENSGKVNIIEALRKLATVLSRKWDHIWHEKLVEIYMQSYSIVWNCLPAVAAFKNTNGPKNGQAVDMAVLFCELHIERWFSCTSCTETPHICLNYPNMDWVLQLHGNILVSLLCCNLECDETFISLTRLLWLQFKVQTNEKRRHESLKTLKMLLHLLKRKPNFTDDFYIHIPNCKNDPLISIKVIEDRIGFLMRWQKLFEVDVLYKEKRYEELSLLLKQSLNYEIAQSSFMGMNIIEADKYHYLWILIESLYNLHQYEECWNWSEMCLHDSWLKYMSDMNNETTISYIRRAILHSLDKLCLCISSAYIPQHRLSRLVKTLIGILCKQLDDLERENCEFLETVKPWILLHHILQQEEDKWQNLTDNLSRKRKENLLSWEVECNENIPSSIMILFKAHEYLGRYGRCCICNGELLKFTIELMIPRLNAPLLCSVKDKIKIYIEQMLYCLYGVSLKTTSAKIKTKSLEDHVKAHKSLSWTSCEMLFEFCKPQSFPTFESKRICSISTETANLYKKLLEGFPKDSDPILLIDEMKDYIVGCRNIKPVLKKPLENDISYIYYFIADYHFKSNASHSWNSCIKYYIADLCLHPNEVNSWIGLAMSTSTLLETWLNNFHPNITEEIYLNNAVLAERSYQKAVKLCPENLTIWTEYGNFVYTVHSFCSRLLKQESDSLNMKRFRILESRKEEMLNVAERCFSTATKIHSLHLNKGDTTDERWLYYYMLGKISEKKNEEPLNFLKLYSKSADLLYLSKAEYPKRISHKNPKNLSIEALEVFYRVHASILKYLENHKGKPIKRCLGLEMQQYLEYSMKSPFMSTKSDSKESVNSNTYNKFKSIERIEKLSRSQSDPNIIIDVMAITEDLVSKACRITEGFHKNSQKTNEPFEDHFQNNLSRPSKMERDECKISKAIEKYSSPEEYHHPTRSFVFSLDNHKGKPSSTSGSDDYSIDDVLEDISNKSDSGSSESRSLKIIDKEDTYLADKEVAYLFDLCLAGLELCVIRFPHHYKSIYRLAHYFFSEKNSTNLNKCKQLLLGVYAFQFHSNQVSQGLFSERKNSNFFNGIWRIPVHEIDRPGSFASHMSRCTVLLIEVLMEDCDGIMLTDLCNQLKKVPEPDKKYLRDTERDQLAHQAITLCLQSYRKKIRVIETQSSKLLVPEQAINLMLDIYSTYQYVKSVPDFSMSLLPKFRLLLEDAYKLFIGRSVIEDNIFENAKECCQQLLREKKSFNSTAYLTKVPLLSDRCTEVKDISTNYVNHIKGDLVKKSFAETRMENDFLRHRQDDNLLDKTSSSPYSSNMNEVNSKRSLTLQNNETLPNAISDFYRCSQMMENTTSNSSYNVNLINSAFSLFSQIGLYQDALKYYKMKSFNEMKKNVVSRQNISCHNEKFTNDNPFKELKKKNAEVQVNSKSEPLKHSKKEAKFKKVDLMDCSVVSVQDMSFQPSNISNTSTNSSTGSNVANFVFANDRNDQIPRTTPKINIFRPASNLNIKVPVEFQKNSGIHPKGALLKSQGQDYLIRHQHKITDFVTRDSETCAIECKQFENVLSQNCQNVGSSLCPAYSEDKTKISNIQDFGNSLKPNLDQCDTNSKLIGQLANSTHTKISCLLDNKNPSIITNKTADFSDSKECKYATDTDSLSSSNIPDDHKLSASENVEIITLDD